MAERRKYTVADLLALKGKARLTEVLVRTPEEAAAAEAAGIDLVSVDEMELTPDFRAAAPNAFFIVGLAYGFHASAEDYIRVGFTCMRMGMDACYSAASVETIRRMFAEGIPVVSHVGLVPSKRTWTGGFKAVGKTAEQALMVYDATRRLEDAGAFAVEMEVVPDRVAAEISQRTAMICLSMGGGADATRNISSPRTSSERTAATTRDIRSATGTSPPNMNGCSGRGSPLSRSFAGTCRAAPTRAPSIRSAFPTPSSKDSCASCRPDHLCRARPRRHCRADGQVRDAPRQLPAGESLEDVVGRAGEILHRARLALVAAQRKVVAEGLGNRRVDADALHDLVAAKAGLQAFEDVFLHVAPQVDLDRQDHEPEQCRVQRKDDLMIGSRELPDAVEAQMFQHRWHQHAVGRQQRADDEVGAGRRGVDEDDVVKDTERIERPGEAAWIVNPDDPVEVTVRRQHVEVDLGRRPDAVREAYLPVAQRRVSGDVAGTGPGREAVTRVPLRVEVDDQDPIAPSREFRSEVDHGGRFAGAALSIGDGDDSRLLDLVHAGKVSYPRQMRKGPFAAIGRVASALGKTRSEACFIAGARA